MGSLPVDASPSPDQVNRSKDYPTLVAHPKPEDHSSSALNERSLLYRALSVVGGVLLEPVRPRDLEAIELLHRDLLWFLAGAPLPVALVLEEGLARARKALDAALAESAALDRDAHERTKELDALRAELGAARLEVATLRQRLEGRRVAEEAGMGEEFAAVPPPKKKRAPRKPVQTDLEAAVREKAEGGNP